MDFELTLSIGHDSHAPSHKLQSALPFLLRLPQTPLSRAQVALELVDIQVVDEDFSVGHRYDQSTGRRGVG